MSISPSRSLGGAQPTSVHALELFKEVVRQLHPSPEIGIAIDSTSIRAIKVQNGRGKRILEIERQAEQPLEKALAEILVRVRAMRGSRLRPLAVAVSGEYAQMKRLSGLPATEDERLLAAVVRENVGRFFPVPGRQPYVGSIRIVTAGEAWATAYDADAIDAVENAFARTGFRVKAVVPTAAVLSGALRGNSIVWRDGVRTVAISLDANNRIEAVRRITAITEHERVQAPDGPTPVPGLAALGPTAWRYAGAYGAVVAGASEPTRLTMRRSKRDSEPSLRRVSVAACVLAFAIAGTCLAPGLRAKAEARAAAEALRKLEQERASVTVTQQRLAQATHSLQEIARFDRERRPVLPLLAEIATRLPEGSAVVAFTVDSSTGTIVALGPRAAAVVAALEASPGVLSPEILGPVTRETSRNGPALAAGSAGATQERERVTVRFRRDLPKRAVSR